MRGLTIELILALASNIFLIIFAIWGFASGSLDEALNFGAVLTLIGWGFIVLQRALFGSPLSEEPGLYRVKWVVGTGIAIYLLGIFLGEKIQRGRRK